MIYASFTRTILRNLLGAGLICTAFSFGTNAQVQTQTQVQNGTPTQQVEVRRGQVVYVSGNDVVIKGDDGRIRDFPNVPEDARVTVDGQQLGVHELVPGMTIERTTITTTTPRVITTIKSVTGTVWQVNPPTSVILTLENGENQQFRIPQGTQFTVDGQPADAFSLRPGMKVSATAVTEVPETVVATEVTRTGEMPPLVETLDPHIALLIILVPYDASADTTAADSSESATDTDAAAAAPAEEAPAQLPKTGSSLPLVALLGGLLCSIALGLRARRAFSA
jgi:LPXTG-motif cell wall-anchored protein